MKRFIYFIGALMFSLTANAQNIADFENLTVPESGYFNGSSEHSGTIGQTESFNYESGPFVFQVNYTPEDGYDYWSGIGYSNQTDLSTADWTNYSAYSNAPDGGGFENSENYAVGYFGSSIEIMLSEGNEELQISGLYISNHVWTYHYMNGSDGSGSGTFETGDYYKLIFTDDSQNTVEFYLADFTGDNAYIIDDWTYVDLSGLAGTGFTISYESSDDWTPAYFCIDNIAAENAASAKISEEKSIQLYPNPADNFLHLTGIKQECDLVITDISGRTVKLLKNTNSETIDISDLTTGLYFLRIENQGLVKKFMKL